LGTAFPAWGAAFQDVIGLLFGRFPRRTELRYTALVHTCICPPTVDRSRLCNQEKKDEKIERANM
jgi:hypothetical protein